MSGITRESAIELAESRFWEGLTYRERAGFQLFEERLCMPFGVFHEAVEKSLGRPVFTHEFGIKNHVVRLQGEFLGEQPAPSLEEIIELIPPEKRILVTLEEE